MRNRLWARVGLACHLVLTWALLATLTDLFVGVPQLLLLAVPAIGVYLTFVSGAWVGLVFLAATAATQVAYGAPPGNFPLVLALGFAVAQALAWWARGRVWNFGRLSRKSRELFERLAPDSVTVEAEQLDEGDLQGMRFMFFRDGELAAILVAVGTAYLQSAERLAPIMSGHKGVPKMVLPMEVAADPEIATAVLAQVGILKK